MFLKALVTVFVVCVSSLAAANVADMKCLIVSPSGPDVHPPPYNEFTVPSVYPAPCDRISCAYFTANYGISLPLQDLTAAVRYLTVTAEFYGPSGAPTNAYFVISDASIWNGGKVSSAQLAHTEINLVNSNGLVDVQISGTTNDGYSVIASCKSVK